MAPSTQFSQLDLTKTYSYADYLTWKFDEFVELIKGRVMRPVAGPSWRRQVLSSNILRQLLPVLRGTPCQVYHAPFDVRLVRGGANGDQQIRTVIPPDICVVCDPAKLDDRGCVGAPDWIIEIVLPGNTAHDTKTKFDLYEESGVREYWIVYPGLKTITAYMLENAEYQLAGEYIEPGPMPAATQPGLMVEWSEIFDE
ncbi:MAG: Uma2 family endonuclease [Hymenobacter sp.]|nr:MAG: Uma2 family endonuclease [Hymenobacter sp.]